MFKIGLCIELIVYFSCLSFVIAETPSLPHCLTDNSGFLIVSTLDGKLTAVDSVGNLTWQIETGPGPLLVSNIHNLELTNNGEWIRIIPSLTGTLYKFDGSTIDPISINAETLLKSSFKYSDDLVIAGSIEVRTYGIGFRSGQMYYECTPRKCENRKDSDDDVLLIERSTHTVRAVEPRTGIERWNFSVGLPNIKLPSVSCANHNGNLFDWNITTILPEGVLKAKSTNNNIDNSWEFKFASPIVRVWRWNGLKLTEINLFASKNIPNLVVSSSLFPSIYLGMHQKQLYIHESVTMQNMLSADKQTDIVVADSNSVAKIPWKPVAASTEGTDDDATALSVLNNSEYVNGNGYYFYSDTDIQKKNLGLCEKNHSAVNSKNSIPLEDEIENVDDTYYWNKFFFKYTKEIALVISTIILCTLLSRFWNTNILEKQLNSTEIVESEKLPDTVTASKSNTTVAFERKISEKDETFTSRFIEDFETIRCLGKGGFGVVFEVKQKIDECYYAIKRITLPKEIKSRERVMREVKALAKLDHQNIVRYFCSWVEKPPLGWQKEHDQHWIEDKSFLSEFTTTKTNTSHSKPKRSKSVSISIEVPLQPQFNDDLDFDVEISNNVDDDDSFIVFENETPQKPGLHMSMDELATMSLQILENTKTTTNNDIQATVPSTSQHVSRKIDWKRPGRKHHSWDMSQCDMVLQKPQQDDEPPVYLYIQMQLCQKESLKEWLQMKTSRNYDLVLNIFLQILDAVEYVHLRGLIHRDLKPGNIFFSLDGQIKVGDFGLVKDMEDSLDLELSRSCYGSTRKGHTKEVGTKLYMSPEQSLSRLYNYKVDIYSLGLIFFELLVSFSTDMERIKTLTNLKKDIYPVDFQKKFPNEFILLQNMLGENPETRLTTIGIKAKAPFNKKDAVYGEDCYYSLKGIQKT